uniref:(northern house mosquito) hypothetical protein n=1 Tax=Culex pipiens TaxID=7175 RepID=A0A8D8AM99_CULPI
MLGTGEEVCDATMHCCVEFSTQLKQKANDEVWDNRHKKAGHPSPFRANINPARSAQENHSIAGRREVNNNLDLEADGLEAQKQLAEKQLAWNKEQPKRRQASQNN